MPRRVYHQLTFPVSKCRHSSYRSILSLTLGPFLPCKEDWAFSQGTDSNHPFLGPFWFRTHFLLIKYKAKWLPCSTKREILFRDLGIFFYQGHVVMAVRGLEMECTRRNSLLSTSQYLARSLETLEWRSAFWLVHSKGPMKCITIRLQPAYLLQRSHSPMRPLLGTETLAHLSSAESSLNQTGWHHPILQSILHLKNILFGFDFNHVHNFLAYISLLFLCILELHTYWGRKIYFVPIWNSKVKIEYFTRTHTRSKKSSVRAHTRSYSY